MLVKFVLSDGETLTSNLSEEAYHLILTSWQNKQDVVLSRGKIAYEDLKGIEVLENE